MENSEPLAWFGMAVILIMGVFVLVPYLRGKSDLLTGWNILLLSIAFNTGVGGLEVRYGEWSWPFLQWFQPTEQEVHWCIVANIVFIVTLFVCYYFNPIPGYLTSRTLVRWPPQNSLTDFYVLAVCVGFMVASFFTRKIPFIAQFVNQLSFNASVFAVVFSFMLWYRNRVNAIWLILFVGVFFGSVFFSLLVYVGRRLLISLFIGPLLVVYWISIRYWKPRNCLLAMSGVAMLAFTVSVAYNSFRFFHTGHSGEERTAQNILGHVKGLGSSDWTSNFTGNKLHYFSQYCVHYSLLAERFVDDGRMPPKPLNTLAFLLAFPIPHAWWEGKPETIGITMVRDVVGDPSTNWGVGIAGHGAYEGGLPALVLYAFLVAFGIRFLDDPIVAQPTNLFLIANFASAAPHVLSFARGDFGIFTIVVIKSFIFMMLLAWGARLLFGTVRQVRRSGPTRAQLAQYRGRTALSGRP